MNDDLHDRIGVLEAENERLRAQLARLPPADANSPPARAVVRDHMLQAVVDHMPSMIGYWDRDLRNCFCNRAYHEWFGLTPAQALGRHIRDVIGEERYRLNLPYIERVLRGEAQRFERSIPTPDGSRVRHSLAEYLPDIVDGQVVGFYVLVSDVTSLKEAELALRAQEELLERTVQQRTASLRQAIAERERTEEDLRALAATLEQRVAERTRQLTEARHAAEVANLAKSQFLANMSHELRTPLNSLLILAKLLAENASENLTTKQAEYARVIHGAGSDLLEMINDLLDLAKIEAGHIQVDTDEVHFAALHESVMRSLGPLAQTKGLAFDIERAAGLPAVMHTDAVRLQQVLRNLIGNAVKFTATGRVSLRIEPASSGWSARHPTLSQAPAVIAFSVSDTGIGIAADKQQLIFEAFQQAEVGTARSYGGTGLGLSISREIARLLDGELTLRSELGVGSTFTLYLPLGAAAATALAPPVPWPAEAMAPAVGAAPAATFDRHAFVVAGEPGPLTGRKVLLVDDDVRNVFATSAMLEQHGLVVIPALSGGEALALLPQHPDTAAVLIDIMMPEMDGYETTRRLRAMSGYAALPVIALTARAMAGDRELCLAAGCSDYLPKPASGDRLLATLRDWLHP